jgi:peroxiredoxin
MYRIIFTMVFLALFISLPGCEQEAPQVREKGDFTLRDVSGGQVTLSALRGKVVLMEFWATWCPPCRKSIPELKELHNNLKGEDFALLAIAVKDKESKVRRFISKHEIPYTVLIDDKGVADEFKAYSIPSTVILDREGKVVLNHRGYAPGMFKDVEEEIRKHL